MHQKRQNTQYSERLMRNATTASVIVALILACVKFYAWILTDSISIFSALIDSMMDMIISFVNLIAVRYALIPPDKDHRFGYSAAEDIAALVQSAFIAGSAIFIMVAAIGRILNPQELENSSVAIAVMIFSIVITLLLVVFQKYVAKKTGSTAIEADSIHYVSDLFMNIAIILAIVLSSKLGWKYADPVFGIFVAAYILREAWKIGKTACNKLMDKEFNEEEKQKICNAVLSFPGALGMHDLKTRSSGIKPFIQLHLEMDKNLTLLEAHDIADGLEKKLCDMYPMGEVIIHEDPV